MTSPPDPAMSLATGGVSAPCPVAEVMRRVQAQLRAGRAPSFEAMLALGEPGSRPGVR